MIIITIIINTHLPRAHEFVLQEVHVARNTLIGPRFVPPEFARREDQHITDSHRVATPFVLNLVDIFQRDVERFEVSLQTDKVEQSTNECQVTEERERRRRAFTFPNKHHHHLINSSSHASISKLSGNKNVAKSDMHI